MDIIDFLYYVLLGLIQGVTEFLPVSSSGHLEIIKFFFPDFGFTNSMELFITIALHLATALSIVVIFHKKIKNLILNQSKANILYLCKILVALIPAVIVGLLFESDIKYFFTGNITTLPLFFLFTAIILYLTEKIQYSSKELTFYTSALIGFAQALAIFPGISRSGITICVALFLGVKKSEAASFSFIISLPLIFGVMAKEILFGYSDLQADLISINYLPLIISFLISFFVGLVCCKYMLKIVEKNNLVVFSYYCFFLAILLYTSTFL